MCSLHTNFSLLTGVCLAVRPVVEELAPMAQDTPEDVPHDQVRPLTFFLHFHHGMRTSSYDHLGWKCCIEMMNWDVFFFLLPFSVPSSKWVLIWMTHVLLVHDQCGVTSILNDDERMELLALGFDDQIYHKWQNYDGTWSNWVGLGGNFSSGAQPVRNIDGRVELFAIGKDDQLYHNWQQTAGGPYQVRPALWFSLLGQTHFSLASKKCHSSFCLFVCFWIWVWICPGQLGSSWRTLLWQSFHPP
jgi:hypothetical protein